LRRVGGALKGLKTGAVAAAAFSIGVALTLVASPFLGELVADYLNRRRYGWKHYP
jgi:hypothetical protein